MNEGDFKAWLGEVPTLTQTQLETALKAFKAISKTGGPTDAVPSKGKSDFDDRVVNCVCEVMKGLGVETPSAKVLRRSNAYAVNKNKFADIKTFLDKVSDQRIIQDAILKTGIDLLYHDLLKWKGVSISSHTLLQQIHRIPATLNRHFPGYSITGNLDKIVKVSS